jgi:hypothetical protein
MSPGSGQVAITPSGTNVPVTQPLVAPQVRATDANGRIHAKKKRSYEEPIGKRDYSSRRKDAYEKAKKAGDGGEPILHPDQGHGPHYHPTKNGKQFNHDHYFF